MTPLAWIDGAVGPLTDARLPVLDEGLLRGDGAFETVGVWDGRAFRLEAHLQRLGRSLAALALPAPDLDALREGVRRVLEGTGGGDAVLRLYALAGGRLVVTLAAQPVRPALRALATQPAPWIRPLGSYAAAGAKTLSYAANMAAARRAQAAGADDALLLALEGWLLEGTTFALLWVRDGVLRTPALELGIVDSISRAALLELARAEGLVVEEGRWRLDELAGASEVLVCSSVRPCAAVSRIDDLRLPEQAPVCARLAPQLEAARRAGD